MKFAIAAALSLASFAVAAPGACLTESTAKNLMLQWSQMMSGQNSTLGSPNATAQAIIANGYYEVSDSVESLINANGTVIPLGTEPTNKGKQQNIASLLANPVHSVTTIETLVAGCSKIIWYWNMDITGAPGAQEVKGINIFTVDSAHKIINSYFEFNSIAWGTNTHQLPVQCYSG